jgi:hypothetical protein
MLSTYTTELRNKTLREVRRALRSQFYKSNTTLLSGACSFRPPDELKLLPVADRVYDSYGGLYRVVILFIVHRLLCAHLYTVAAGWHPRTRVGLQAGSDIARLERDGTCAETRFGLSAKRTSPFKSAGASVQSTTGSRRVRISGSNAGYTMFRGRVQVYWLPSPLACFPFTSPTVRHRVPSGFN